MEESDTNAFVCRVFACPPAVAGAILAQGRVRTYAADAVVVRQGDRVSLTYLLVIGRARAMLCSPDGQLFLLHEFAPGDVFGALGDDDDLQEAEIVAIEAVSALTIEAARLAELAQRHGTIGLALSRLLIRRLREANTRMFERATLSAMGRVYAELLRLARQREDLSVRPPPVISDLALRVATTRETASRAVSAIERRGIVRREADALIVVAPHRLEALVL